MKILMTSGDCSDFQIAKTEEQFEFLKGKQYIVVDENVLKNFDNTKETMEKYAPGEDFSFSGIVRETKLDGKKHNGVWTDGIGAYSDHEDLAAYKLQKGHKYKVTFKDLGLEK